MTNLAVSCLVFVLELGRGLLRFRRPVLPGHIVVAFFLEVPQLLQEDCPSVVPWTPHALDIQFQNYFATVEDGGKTGVPLRCKRGRGPLPSS